MEKRKENRRKKHNAGITLIALIITIIILLILAMVTIRILMNQGIIKHAQNATEAYNEAQNNETEYLTYAEGEMDKYAGVSGDSGGSSETVPGDLEKYFLGVNEDGSVGTGQDISIVANMEQAGMFPSSYKDNEVIDDASTSVTNLNTLIYNADTAYVYVKYQNKAYRVTTNYNESFVFTTKSVDLVYTPDAEGVEGTKKTHNGAEWTVLYNNGSTVEIVSPTNIGTYKLGYNDPAESENTGSNLEKAISSYNNAVTRLNSYCRTTLSDNTARSVGSNPSSPDSSTTTYYSSSNTENWNTDYNGRGLVSDNNAEQDYVRMCYWGVISSDDSYWLASRIVGEGPGDVGFCVKIADSGGGWAASISNLWDVSPSNAYGNDSGSVGVRACVTVNK